MKKYTEQEILDMSFEALRDAVRSAQVTPEAHADHIADASKMVAIAAYNPATFCATNCKTMCQNSVHGVCDGVPAQSADDQEVVRS